MCFFGFYCCCLILDKCRPYSPSFKIHTQRILRVRTKVIFALIKVVAPDRKKVLGVLSYS